MENAASEPITISDYFSTLLFQAVDRHLLGLKMVAMEKGLELPNIFRDHSYVYASRYKLSTSQVNEIQI